MFPCCSPHPRSLEDRQTDVPPSVDARFCDGSVLAVSGGTTVAGRLRLPRLWHLQGLASEAKARNPGMCRLRTPDLGDVGTVMHGTVMAGTVMAGTVMAGTVMHPSHLPLRTWFLVAHILTSHSNGMSALQLRRSSASIVARQLGFCCSSSGGRWSVLIATY